MLKTVLTLLALACIPSPSDEPPTPLAGPGSAAPAIGLPLRGTPAQLSQAMRTSQQDFAGELYRKASGDAPNAFLSPASAHLALGMTAAGARGRTSSQMNDALRLSKLGNPHADFGALMQAWADGGAVELGVANRVWVEQSLPLEDDFVKLIGEHYAGGFEAVDFLGDHDASRKRVNAWVAKQTHDRIPDLLAPAHVTPATRLVLTNAVYFLGDWALPFDAAGTRNSGFVRPDGSTVQVPFMAQSERLPYAEVGGSQVLQLPYQGDRFSMVVVLPGRDQPLSTVEASFGAEAIQGWMSALSVQPVDVYLPKFEVRGSYELTPALQAMGMKDAFTDAADFSGMTTAQDLQISAVVHKTFIKVDEKGTEAAGATAVVMRETGAALVIEPPPVFRADHSFLYFLWDAQTQTPLFVGRVGDPSL